MDEPDITGWIQAAKDGDDEAFGRIVRFFLPMTERFLRQWIREQDVLEDIVQESFIKAWRHLGRFDEDKSFPVWLLTIAKRTAFDALKKKKSLPFSSFALEGENDARFDVADTVAERPDDRLDRELQADELQNALDRLPELYRSILMMHYREDLSLAEVAEVLEIPYNTIKSRHTRAVAALRKILTA